MCGVRPIAAVILPLIATSAAPLLASIRARPGSPFSFSLIEALVSLPLLGRALAFLSGTSTASPSRAPSLPFLVARLLLSPASLVIFDLLRIQLPRWLAGWWHRVVFDLLGILALSILSDSRLAEWNGAT